MPKPEDHQILNRQEEPSMTEPSLEVRTITFGRSSATVDFECQRPDGSHVFFKENVPFSSDQGYDPVVKQAHEQLFKQLAQISSALDRIIINWPA